MQAQRTISHECLVQLLFRPGRRDRHVAGAAVRRHLLECAPDLRQGERSVESSAEQAFQNYLAVLAVSLLALFPGISVPTFAGVAIGVTGLYAVYVVLRFWQATASRIIEDEHRSRVQIVRRYVSSLIGFGMMIVAAILMASQQIMELNLFAAATIVLLFSATEVSWAFLKRVAQLEGD